MMPKLGSSGNGDARLGNPDAGHGSIDATLRGGSKEFFLLHVSRVPEATFIYTFVQPPKYLSSHLVSQSPCPAPQNTTIANRHNRVVLYDSILRWYSTSTSRGESERNRPPPRLLSSACHPNQPLPLQSKNPKPPEIGISAW